MDGKARALALGILQQREAALRRRLRPGDPAAASQLPDFQLPSRARRIRRNYGAVFALVLLLLLVAGLMSAEAPDAIPIVWISCAVSLFIVGFNNELYLRGRRLHARQEAARLEYEWHTLPDIGTDGLNLAIARIEKLLERLDRQERLLTQLLMRNIFLALVLGVPLLGLGVAVAVDGAAIKAPAAAAAFELLSLVAFLVVRNRARQLEGAVQQADYELSLLVADLTPEQRAERLYLKQQFELKRYYDEALRQSTSLSYIGAGCVGAGFTVVGVTFALLHQQSGDAQVEVAVVGGVGGILANFVAIVFLQMHSGTVRALTSFQTKLVRTNHLHLANLLASRIGAEGVSSVQGAALARLASEMAQESLTPIAGQTDE